MKKVDVEACIVAAVLLYFMGYLGMVLNQFLKPNDAQTTEVVQ